MDALSKKVCKNCKEEKYGHEFYTTPQTIDGLMGQCKDCVRKKQIISKNKGKPKDIYPSRWTRGL